MSTINGHSFDEIVLECFSNLIQNEGFAIKREQSNNVKVYLENGKCGIIVKRDASFSNHFIDFYDPNIVNGEDYHYSYVVQKVVPEVAIIHKKKRMKAEKNGFYFKKMLKGNSKFIETHLQIVIQGNFNTLKEGAKDA